MNKNKNIVVLYHKGCEDGFGAAWAAWKKFGARAEYIGVNHGDKLPADLARKDIYMVDFTYPAKEMRRLLKICKKVVALDHHVSSMAATMLAHDYRYNINHSGAGLAWKYFHPKKPIPKLLKYIENVDIWKMSLPYVYEIAASLGTYEFEFYLWNKIAKDFENTRSLNKYIEEGKAILKYKNVLIKKALKDAEEVRFFGKRALAVNFALALNSDIGDAMRKRGFQLGIIWQKKGDKLVVSLRSTNKVDSSKIAMKFGGGGHKKAAAFRLPINQKFPWKKIKK
ncbi:MAG: DHHA1 domain-containing protein [Candidatus Giovannonibacteria bacterium]|nr:DHHA1 domain-containing protein [Candidatus Giovannonibacteria bacterium]